MAFSDGNCVDFNAAFTRLAESGQREQTVVMGGVSVRLVRVAGGAGGRWDMHPDTAETVVVWSGDFRVEFRQGQVTLGAGGCCVVPRGEAHRGTSLQGAEVVLLQTV